MSNNNVHNGSSGASILSSWGDPNYRYRAAKGNRAENLERRRQAIRSALEDNPEAAGKNIASQANIPMTTFNLNISRIKARNFQNEQRKNLAAMDKKTPGREKLIRGEQRQANQKSTHIRKSIPIREQKELVYMIRCMLKTISMTEIATSLEKNRTTLYGIMKRFQETKTKDLISDTRPAELDKEMDAKLKAFIEARRNSKVVPQITEQKNNTLTLAEQDEAVEIMQHFELTAEQCAKILETPGITDKDLIAWEKKYPQSESTLEKSI